MQSLTFNVSHFELAWIYKQIADRAPVLLKKKDPDPAFDERQKRIYKWLLVLNIVVPLTELFGYQHYGKELYIDPDHKPEAFDIWVFNLPLIGVGALEIISGIISVRSIATIRHYFKDNSAG